MKFETVNKYHELYEVSFFERLFWIKIATEVLELKKCDYYSKIKYLIYLS